MKKLLLIVILLLIIVAVGWGLHLESGVVLVTYRSWQIETRLSTAILLILLAFIVAYIIIRLIISTSHWPQRWRQWRQASRHRRSERTLELAVCDSIEEKWAAAEQYFNQSAEFNSQPLLCYLGAAIAAQAQGADLRRDHYLQTAYEIAPEAEITLGILKAQLQIQAQQWQEALATLQKLEAAAPHHPKLIQLKKLLHK